jgi:hypothetical protein
LRFKRFKLGRDGGDIFGGGGGLLRSVLAI